MAFADLGFWRNGRVDAANLVMGIDIERPLSEGLDRLPVDVLPVEIGDLLFDPANTDSKGSDLLVVEFVKHATVREKLGGGRIGKGLPDAGERGLKAVIIALRNGIEFVVMATSTIRRETKESLRNHPHHFFQLIFSNGFTFAGDGRG